MRYARGLVGFIVGKVFAAALICGLTLWAFFSVLLDVAIPTIYAEGHFGRGVMILLLDIIILFFQQSTFLRVCFGDPGKVSPDTYMVRRLSFNTFVLYLKYF